VKVNLAYGQTGLNIDLPDDVDVIQPADTPGLNNESDAILDALRHPHRSPSLSDRVKPGSKVVVTHSDITRPTPNSRMLPVLLAELERSGVQRRDITLVNALGTHKQPTEDDNRALLGNWIVDNYHCTAHNAFNDSFLAPLGSTSFGHPVRLNKLLLESDLNILTGFIEPHFFAGFSGGPKGILPALAGKESVFTNHGYPMLAHPKADWGICEGNPVWDEMCEMALKVPNTFLLNVTLNRTRMITGVFAGDLVTAHKAGRNFVAKHAMIKVDHAYDVVLTTNNGYPLDQNLYQTVKGMSAARKIVRKGGAILIASACSDGLPDYGKYMELLEKGGSPRGVIDMISQPGFEEHDQWEVQVQAYVQLHADVHVYSGGLTDAQIRRALLTPCRDISTRLGELRSRYGHRTCVIPDGPMTVAYL
jgi:lactate racemase